jgi:hypothetical protein
MLSSSGTELFLYCFLLFLVLCSLYGHTKTQIDESRLFYAGTLKINLITQLESCFIRWLDSWFNAHFEHLPDPLPKTSKIYHSFNDNAWECIFRNFYETNVPIHQTQNYAAYKMDQIDTNFLFLIVFGYLFVRFITFLYFNNIFIIY